MTAVRAAVRGATGLVLAVAVAVSVVSLVGGQDGPRLGSPHLATAADPSTFRAGNIISDAVFYDSGAMGTTQVQGFLRTKGASCRKSATGPACLKDYTMATPSRAADSLCPGRYAGSSRESAASIIVKVSVACDINPRVLLVTLQKEMGLVTSSSPTAKMYTRAMGFACPDTTGGTCDSAYNGLFNQLYSAAKQFQRYRANPTKYGHKPGVVNQVRWHPNAACGAGAVTIQNQATAGLYNYTPYQPNAQALAAGYGTGGSCSSYGNRNFWLYFTDWFGSTQTVGRDVDAPVGSLDQVSAGTGSVSVRGWAVDFSAPTTSIDVHVYVDGRFAGPLRANISRPDVAATYPEAGSAHGFSGSVVAAQGKRSVCVYAVNTGPGYTNPRLGCRAVTVPTSPAHVPVGNLESVRVSALSVAVTGWAIDPDAQTTPVRVHLYVDGRWRGAVTADESRPDVARAYPRAGELHGFEWGAALPAGRHEICAYAINLGAGRANPKLGCRTVTLGGSPVGALELVSVSPARVRVVGWTIDPDTVDPISVHAWINGAYAGADVADVARPELETVRPGYGTAHGFDVTVPAVGGEADVCLYGIDVGSGSNRQLGCRTVQVPYSPPIGNVDSATVSGTTVTTLGWALDKDAPTQAVQVHLYVDGGWRASIPANRPRGDIASAFPGAGPYHGWSHALTLSSGNHRICAYGINVPAGTGSNPQLACRDVVVP